MSSIVPELLEDIEACAKCEMHFKLMPVPAYALVAHLREVERERDEAKAELREQARVFHDNQWRQLDEMTAEREALAANLSYAKEALEQAQSCILNETPEDMTHEEARADTLEKIRKVLSSGFIEVVNPYDKGEFEDGEVPEVDLARAIAKRDELAAKLEEAKETLDALLAACDKGRLAIRSGCGVGGMTIEANLKASVINGVSAWEVQEAKDALFRLTAEATKGGEA